MRILIDLQGAQTSSRFRGIGRYSLGIAKGILRNAKGHEIFILLSGNLADQVEQIRYELNDYVSQNHILVWEGVGPTAYRDSRNQWRRKASELIWETYITKINPDVILITSYVEGYGDDFVATVSPLNRNIPVAIIFYDLIPFLYPKDYLSEPDYKSWYQDRIDGISKTNYLLAISSASKKDAIEFLGFSQNRVENISAAVPDEFSQFDRDKIPTNFLQKIGIHKPFLMYCSATDARKNHLRLIEAYATLDSSVRKTHQLVFAGGIPPEHQNVFQKSARKFGLARDELIFTKNLNDDQLKFIYSQCKAFVFPSWYEGFGFPILEAMQFNKPVIASNCSSIPEIISHDGGLFDPLNTGEIAAKIQQVLTDEEYRLSLEKNSRRQVQKFSWDKSARIAIAALERWISLEKAKDNVKNQKLLSKPSSNLFDNALVNKLIDRITQISFPHSESDLLKTSQSISLNHRIALKPQLLVDISVLVDHDARTGIQRVVRNVLREWMIKPPDGFIVKPVYCTLDKPYRYAENFIKRFFDKTDMDEPNDEIIEFSNGDQFIGLDLLHPHQALRHHSFYQKMRNHGVKVQFIVYDLLPILLPSYVVEGAPKGHENWLRLVTQTDGAICISQSVANELKDWLLKESIQPSPFFEISWFHLGAEPEHDATKNHLSSKDEEISITELFRSKPSFLCVGTLEPRKGHIQVLRAFEQLWSQSKDINLVFVGKKGWKIDDLIKVLEKHPQRNKHLFWFEAISDDFLNEIYQSCSCLIAASEGEGFGLPLIEAAYHGIPILARDLPVFREIAGEHAHYFTGKDPQELTSAIEEWLVLASQSRQVSSKGMTWLSWRQSVNQLESAMQLDKFPHNNYQ